MEKHKEDGSIEFYSNLEVPDDDGPPTSLGAVPGLSRRFPFLKREDVEEAIEGAVGYLRDYLGRLAPMADSDQFSLEEAEVTIQVTKSGKATIMLADVGGSIQGGIKLKWKRRALNEGGRDAEDGAL